MRTFFNSSMQFPFSNFQFSLLPHPSCLNLLNAPSPGGWAEVRRSGVRMKFLSRGAAALAVTVLFPIMAAAQQPASRPQLSEQQREQLRTLEEQQRQALEVTQRELGDLHRQLNEQLTAAQPDTGRINSLRSAIVQKQTQLAQARVDRLAK